MISVIIPVRDGVAGLGACLAALAGSEAAPEEVIVVDDASSDGSAECARRMGARLVQLDRQSGPARARNAGAEAARGDILVFIDSDVTVHRDTLSLIREVLAARPDLDALFGCYDDQPVDQGLVSQYRNLLHAYTHRVSRPQASTFWTGCGAIRRQVFLDAGGFDETRRRPCMEDVELGWRLLDAGKRIALDLRIQVQHAKRWRFWPMVWNDIFVRAIPWTILIFRHRRFPDDMNLAWRQRMSLACTVGGVGLLAAGAFVRVWLLAACVAALGCAAWLNRGFYRFLACKRGMPFALACIPLHWVYFLCGAAGFVLALLLLLGRRLRPDLAPPSTS